MNNLEYYCRNAVVTKQDLNVYLIIGELEKVVSVREATVGEKMCPQFSGIESELASEAERDFLLEPKEERMRRMLY